MNRTYFSKLTGMITVAVFATIISVVQVNADNFQNLETMDDATLQTTIETLKATLDQDKTDVTAAKKLGIAYHIIAQKNPKAHASKALEYLTLAFEADPSDMTVMCYLGSATSLMAKTTFNPMKKMSYANKGIALMDKAARKSPENVNVRLTRGFNSLSLPDFFNRGDIAVKDFNFLADLIKKDPEAYASIKPVVALGLKKIEEKNKKTN